MLASEEVKAYRRQPLNVNLSTVIPAYNEEDMLEDTVESVRKEHRKHYGENYEIIIVEDGCNDRTPEIAGKLEERYKEVSHLHFKERQGRGRAVEEAFRQARGEILVYMDADLATDVSHLDDLISCIEDGYSIVTGSRRLASSDADRTFSRRVASWGFNSATQFLFNSGVKDHQCGFKAFDREVMYDLIKDVDRSHWFWDTEILIRAQKRGYRVKELPITWREKQDSKVDLLKDTLEMGLKMLHLLLILNTREKYGKKS